MKFPIIVEFKNGESYNEVSAYGFQIAVRSKLADGDEVKDIPEGKSNMMFDQFKTNSISMHSGNFRLSFKAPQSGRVYIFNKLGVDDSDKVKYFFLFAPYFINNSWAISSSSKSPQFKRQHGNFLAISSPFLLKLSDFNALKKDIIIQWLKSESAAPISIVAASGLETIVTLEQLKSLTDLSINTIYDTIVGKYGDNPIPMPVKENQILELSKFINSDDICFEFAFVDVPYNKENFSFGFQEKWYWFDPIKIAKNIFKNDSRINSIGNDANTSINAWYPISESEITNHPRIFKIGCGDLYLFNPPFETDIRKSIPSSVLFQSNLQSVSIHSTSICDWDVKMFSIEGSDDPSESFVCSEYIPSKTELSDFNFSESNLAKIEAKINENQFIHTSLFRPLHPTGYPDSAICFCSFNNMRPEYQLPDGAELPQGKGVYIASLSKAGTKEEIYEQIQDLGLSWIAVQTTGIESPVVNGKDRIKEYAQYFSSNNINVFIWGWVFPKKSDFFIENTKTIFEEIPQIKGVIIDAERHWKEKDANEALIMTEKLLNLSSKHKKAIGVAPEAGAFLRNYPKSSFLNCHFISPQIYDPENNGGKNYAKDRTSGWLKIGYKIIIPSTTINQYKNGKGVVYHKSHDTIIELLKNTPVLNNSIIWWSWSGIYNNSGRKEKKADIIKKYTI